MRLLPTLIAAGSFIATGVLCGHWSGRWGVPADLAGAAAALPRVPMTLAGWEGRALDLNPRQQELAEITAYLHRSYVHRRSNANVTVLLVCGRPGPIAVHPPDICYGGLGYRLMEPPQRYAVPPAAPAPGGDFRVGTFVKEEAGVPTYLRIFWSWSGAGDWQTPDNPRWAFARTPVLYKLYVMRRLTSAAEPVKDDPSLEFLHVFLPEVQGVLFPPSPG